MPSHDRPPAFDFRSLLADYEQDTLFGMKKAQAQIEVEEKAYHQLLVDIIVLIVAAINRLIDDPTTFEALRADAFWQGNRPPPHHSRVAARFLLGASRTGNRQYQRAYQYAKVAQDLYDQGVKAEDVPEAIGDEAFSSLLGRFDLPPGDDSDAATSAELNDERVPDDEDLVRPTRRRAAAKARSRGAQRARSFPFDEEEHLALRFGRYRDRIMESEDNRLWIEVERTASNGEFREYMIVDVRNH